MLIHFNKENKLFDKIDEANRALVYCPLNRADDQDKQYMQRAKEIARMNIYNAFFDNISLLKQQEKKIYEIIWFQWERSISELFFKTKFR